MLVLIARLLQDDGIFVDVLIVNNANHCFLSKERSGPVRQD